VMDDRPYDERRYCRDDGDCGVCLSCRRAEVVQAVRACSGGAMTTWVEEAVTALVREAVRYGREG
jgi:hypothetical protein